MPFWKKSFSKARGVYYPRAIVQGNPVETETIAKDLAKIERPHQGAGLFPIRPRHCGRGKPRRL